MNRLTNWFLNLFPQYRSTLAKLADGFEKYRQNMEAFELQKEQFHAQFEEALKVAHQNKAAYEALEKQFNEQGAALVRANDALEQRNTEVGYLREQVSELQRQAIESTQTVANFHSQMLYGIKVFPNASGMEEGQLAHLQRSSIVPGQFARGMRERREHERKFVQRGLEAFQETK